MKKIISLAIVLFSQASVFAGQKDESQFIFEETLANPDLVMVATRKGLMTYTQYMEALKIERDVVQTSSYDACPTFLDRMQGAYAQFLQEQVAEKDEETLDLQEEQERAVVALQAGIRGFLDRKRVVRLAQQVRDEQTARKKKNKKRRTHAARKAKQAKVADEEALLQEAIEKAEQEKNRVKAPSKSNYFIEIEHNSFLKEKARLLRLGYSREAANEIVQKTFSKKIQEVQKEWQQEKGAEHYLEKFELELGSRDLAEKAFDLVGDIAFLLRIDFDKKTFNRDPHVSLVQSRMYAIENRLKSLQAAEVLDKVAVHCGVYIGKVLENKVFDFLRSCGLDIAQSLELESSFMALVALQQSQQQQ